jgi:hypothetical protein
MVKVPCGNDMRKPGQIRAEFCIQGHECDNCTALRGLMPACEEFIQVNAKHGYEFDSNEPELYGRLTAALAAARPEEE